MGCSSVKNGMMQRSIIVFLLGVFIIFQPSVGRTEEDPIKIGVVFAFTGLGQQWSEYGRMGLELALDEINAEESQKKIQLVFEDSQTQPAKAVSAYTRLAKVEGVHFFIGNVWDFITNPLIPLAEKDKNILIAPSVIPEAIERLNPYFFTMGCKVSGLEKAVDRFFKINGDVKSVGILSLDNMWGQAYSKVWKQVAAKNGAVITQEVFVRDLTSTLATEVTKLAAKKPDALFVAYSAEIALARMREQGVKAKVLSTSDMVETVKVRKAAKQLVEDVYFTDWRPSEEFIAKFKAKFGREPILEAHNSYEALRSLAKALRANSGDILSELRKVHYRGVGGEIDFSKGSFVNQGVGELYQVRDGNLELVR